MPLSSNFYDFIKCVIRFVKFHDGDVQVSEWANGCQLTTSLCPNPSLLVVWVALLSRAFSPTHARNFVFGFRSLNSVTFYCFVSKIRVYRTKTDGFSRCMADHVSPQYIFRFFVFDARWKSAWLRFYFKGPWIAGTGGEKIYVGQNEAVWSLRFSKEARSVKDNNVRSLRLIKRFLML